jgi:iron complex outermembrane receptor protein
LRAALLFLIALLTPTLAPTVVAQETGTVRGQVVFDTTGDPVHGALVLFVGTGRSATTDDSGRFELTGVPAGRHEVVAQRDHLSTTRQEVVVAAGQTVELTFRLQLQAIHEEVNVTASSTGTATNFEAFNSIQTLDSFDLARTAAPTLAAAVERVPGVQSRTFGPGSARPIIRGFDGDRVLLLQDSIRTGDLSSQSGDHGTTIDPASVDRIEVVRGPATLLYGSNAVGGVVHTVTPQESFRRTPFNGLRGQFSTELGNNNGQAAGTANVQYGQGRWFVWAGGGSRRLGDYDTPERTVENSGADQSNGRVGVGFAGRSAFFSAGYEAETGRYGIPFAGEFGAHGEDHPAGELFVDIEPRRQNVRVDAGVRDLTSPVVNSARIIVNRSDWRHDEIETQNGLESLGTRFNNDVTNVRTEIEQQKRGRLSGRLGASLEMRDFSAIGEEALSPATFQRAFGLFGYEELALGPARLMFGGRFERTHYDTEDRAVAALAGAASEPAPPAARDRTFSGGSGAAGLHVDLAPGTALVGTLTRSYRAPALEELYNFGPHVGNRRFEIGDTELAREATTGVDVSLRHRSSRLRGEINAFTYGIDDFVYASAGGGEVLDGLLVAHYRQADSRFTGLDGQASIGLGRGIWATAGLGFVRARLVDGGNLPRIPPLNGRIAVDLPLRSVTVAPELTWAAPQRRLAGDETPTDGNAVLNLNASYVMARSHHLHVLSFSGLNLTNELYRRHTSFIKDLAPEMGRSVRVSYAIRFF